MILIADCGSTKIDWCVLDHATLKKQIFTVGMNAVMLTEEEMRNRIAAELIPELAELTSEIEAVYFYGAGCVSEAVCANVASAIAANIPSAKNIEVYSDLLAAARALCGHNTGIACILGTGSNSCLYDGNAIVSNVSPLGFILGDEGSGAVLGKLFIGDLLKNQLPAGLKEKFYEEYNLTYLDVIQKIYREPGANRFLATVAPFINKHIDLPEVHTLVKNAFKAFFCRNIHQYAGYENLKVNFIGSIANYFRPVLEEAAAECGCQIGTVLRSPMDGLLKFHQE